MKLSNTWRGGQKNAAPVAAAIAIARAAWMAHGEAREEFTATAAPAGIAIWHQWQQMARGDKGKIGTDGGIGGGGTMTENGKGTGESCRKDVNDVNGVVEPVAADRRAGQPGRFANYPYTASMRLLTCTPISWLLSPT